MSIPKVPRSVGGQRQHVLSNLVAPIRRGFEGADGEGVAQVVLTKTP